MLTKNTVSWFLTDAGRKVSFVLVTGTGLTLTLAKFAPHSVFLDKYKNFAQYYSNGTPVDLSKEILERYQSCLDKLKLAEVHRKLISPFSVYGYDLFHAGSLNSRFGAAIGIPVNFTYKSIEDLEKDQIQVNQKEIKWASEIGQKLANALILPEKVQQFAICREILMTQNNKFMYESAYPFAWLFGLGSYFLIKDMTEVNYETEVDKKLCELGPDFIESGVIFYDKLLQRNQALRELMGKEGERKYSKMGNENFFIRQPRIALVHRKMYFEEQLENIQKKTEDQRYE
ncbi:hypothetical protein evm_013250 [Chilo suppressalis]|nr:hypothetical protein evm_013250 [Chilo suppressalis]